MALIIGTSDNTYKLNVKGAASNVKMSIGAEALKPRADTAAQAVIKTAGKTASKVIESGGELITAPAVWLKDMQQNWLMYMVVAAIIMGSIAFLYCVVCFRLNRNKNNQARSTMIELAQTLSNKTRALQQLPSLSAPSLAVLPPNLQV